MINWLKKLFNKKSDWTVINRNGKKTFISPAVMDYFDSKLPNPCPSDLVELIRNTQKIIISERSIENIEIDPYKVDYQFKKLFEFDTQDQIKLIGQKLEISPNSEGHLLDNGSIIFEFILENQKKHQIEYLEFTTIRWKEKWKDDARLKDHIGFLDWLKSLGIEKPLNEYNKALEKGEKDTIRHENWRNTAPKSIIESIDKGYQYNYDKIYLKLKQEFSNEKILVLKLFELYGCGLGVWNGFPEYELIPEEILLKFSIESFMEIEDMSELTEEQKHGMARFFSGWGNSKNRKNDIAKLPLKLKNLLLEHLIEIGDENKINQFKNNVLIK